MFYMSVNDNFELYILLHFKLVLMGLHCFSDAKIYVNDMLIYDQEIKLF